MKKNLKFLFAGLALLTVLLTFLKPSTPDPVIVNLEGVLPEMTLDQKIYASEIILIGEVKTVLSSKWNTLREINTKSLSSEDVRKLDFGIYTDAVVEPQKILKGNLPDTFVLRVRTYTGTIEHISFFNSMEPKYQEGQKYLFFLGQDWSSNKNIDPGYYMPVNAGEGAFYLDNGKAVSKDAEWVTDDLVAYIEDSRWALTEPRIPENEDSKEIMKAIESVYNVTAKAGHDFDTGDLSSVFINDPRFLVLPDKLEYTRYFNDSLALNAPGYLDYKTAYYHWWSEYLAQYNNDEWTEKWGSAWEREKSPTWDRPLDIVSIEFDATYATVYLSDGIKLSELYLVKVDKNWYVVGEKGVTTRPEESSAGLIIETPIPVTDTPTLTSVPDELLTETPLPEETPTVTP